MALRCLRAWVCLRMKDIIGRKRPAHSGEVDFNKRTSASGAASNRSQRLADLGSIGLPGQGVAMVHRGGAGLPTNSDGG